MGWWRGLLTPRYFKVGTHQWPFRVRLLWHQSLSLLERHVVLPHWMPPLPVSSPRLTGEQIARLRIVMLANNEIVMKELEKRGPESVT